MRQCREPWDIELLSATDTTATPGKYARRIAPNRSLPPAARWVAWALLCTTTLVIGLGAAVLGAWVVLPFAGAEALLLTWAFVTIARHDRDFERLVIVDDQVVFESRRADEQGQFSGNRQWMTLEAAGSGSRCVLRLAYAGRRQTIGRLLGDAERSAWVHDLGRYLRVVRTSD